MPHLKRIRTCRSLMRLVSSLAPIRLFRSTAILCAVLLLPGQVVNTAGCCLAQDLRQPTDDLSADWELGFEFFRMLLEERGLSVDGSWEEVQSDARSSVVVLMGDLNGAAFPAWEQLMHFVDRGGAVLAASDMRYSPGGFHAGPVVSENPAFYYQNFSDVLRVSDLNSAHPLASGVGELIVNRTGWLRTPADNRVSWHPVARLPRSCLPRESSGQPLILFGEPRGTPISGSASRRGRNRSNQNSSESGLIILAADQSLFTNNMLWHGDNALLAIRTSELLCQGNRSRLLFVADGNVLGSYRDSDLLGSEQIDPDTLPEVEVEVPEPDLNTILRLANSVIQHVQESNLLNEALMKQPRGISPGRYQRSVLLALAVISSLMLIRALSRMSPVTPEPVAARSMLSAHALSSQRSSAGESYGAAAEMLAAEFCRELTGSAVSSDWQRWLNAVTDDSSGQSAVASASDRRALAHVVDLAVRGRRATLTKRQLTTLAKQLIHLRRQHLQQQLITG